MIKVKRLNIINELIRRKEKIKNCYKYALMFTQNLLSTLRLDLNELALNR